MGATARRRPTSQFCVAFRFAAVAATLVAFPVGPAFAQTAADRSAAQGLFDDAKREMQAGDARSACPKFEESQRLDPASGTLLNLALCYERTRRVASAWSTYLEAASASRAAGHTDREKLARERADALAPRVSKLRIIVEDEHPPADLEIRRGKVVVGKAQWGLAIPADLGEYEVVARAAGRKNFRTVARIASEGTVQDVRIPVLQRVQPQTTDAGSSAPIATRQGDASNGVVPSEADDSPLMSTQRYLAVAAGAVGLVGLGVGVAFGLRSKSKHDEAEKYCDGSACLDARGVRAGEDAKAAGNVSTVAFAVGALGMGSGLALWFSAPSSEARQQAQLGIQLSGVW